MENLKITRENIMENLEKLEKLGFNRWQKGTMDRMYINACDLGLTCTYYKTGNISSAEFDGEQISNSEGYRMKSAKTYIDLKNFKVISDNVTLARKVAELIGIEPVDVYNQYTIA